MELTHMLEKHCSSIVKYLDLSIYIVIEINSQLFYSAFAKNYYILRSKNIFENKCILTTIN